MTKAATTTYSAIEIETALAGAAQAWKALDGIVRDNYAVPFAPEKETFRKNRNMLAWSLAMVYGDITLRAGNELDEDKTRAMESIGYWKGRMPNEVLERKATRQLFKIQYWAESVAAQKQSHKPELARELTKISELLKAAAPVLTQYAEFPSVLGNEVKMPHSFEMWSKAVQVSAKANGVAY